MRQDCLVNALLIFRDAVAPKLYQGVVQREDRLHERLRKHPDTLQPALVAAWILPATTSHLSKDIQDTPAVD